MASKQNPYRDGRDGGNHERKDQAQPGLELQKEEGATHGLQYGTNAAVSL